MIQGNSRENKYERKKEIMKLVKEETENSQIEEICICKAKGEFDMQK